MHLHVQTHHLLRERRLCLPEALSAAQSSAAPLLPKPASLCSSTEQTKYTYSDAVMPGRNLVSDFWRNPKLASHVWKPVQLCLQVSASLSPFHWFRHHLSGVSCCVLDHGLVKRKGSNMLKPSYHKQVHITAEFDNQEVLTKYCIQ